VGGLGFVFGDESSTRRVAELIREVYPSATQQELRIVRDLIEGRALSLGLGLVGTLFGATAIYSSLDLGLAAVLGRNNRRNLIRGTASAFAFVGAILLIAVISFAVSYGAAAAQDLLRALGLGREGRTAIGLLGPLLGIVGGYVFFLVIYVAVPRTRLPLRAARIAALVSAVLWEVAKLAFGLFTRTVGAFTAYGPLAFAAGLLTWIYLTGAIILIGAEVMKAMRPSERPA
jgi:YihY family inner membrane protein